MAQEKETATNSTAKKAQDVKQPEAELMELMLPLNPNNPNDDEVTVIVNGEATKIQRGKLVKVPKHIWETVMNSEEQKARAINRRRRAEQIRNAAQSANAI